MRHFDVIIVGGGPAGSSVARNLALGQGIRSALLIEKLDETVFSRYQQMCGEGISRRGLVEEGLDDPSLVRNIVTRAVENWPGKVTLTANIEGVIVDRVKLISKLREPFVAAGGEVLRAIVSKVTPRGERFEVSTSEGSFSCDFLVGADGAHSLVRKQLFGSEPTTYMKVVQYVIDRPMESELRFTFDHKYRGKYRWEFPSGRCTKVGFPEGSDEAPGEVIDTHRRAIPVGRLERIVSGRACLVGDAACQVNPVTFSGIRSSLAAGRMAAKAIMGGDLESYQAAWARSPLSDRTYFDSFLRLREMSNQEIEGLVEPFRHGTNMTSIMKELMNNEGFRIFYRGYVRKLESGW